MQIIIYPLISVRCNVQDEDYNIHDASQRKVSPQYSVFLVLHFLDCKIPFYVLTSFQGANETHLTRDES